ncbi:hypothetical protein BHM03_00019932 [Ensete ventricosum]|nr:hypothetical protein BHM03_00019932 [Ensete ventricosum]
MTPCNTFRFELDMLLKLMNGTVKKAEMLLKVIGGKVERESDIQIENYFTSLLAECKQVSEMDDKMLLDRIAGEGHFIPVVCNFDIYRQVAGTRTARYRAVPPKIDRQRSISIVGGRLKGEIDRRRSLREKSTIGGRLSEKKEEEEEEEKEERIPIAHARSSPVQEGEFSPEVYFEENIVVDSEGPGMDKLVESGTEGRQFQLGPGALAMDFVVDAETQVNDDAENEGIESASGPFRDSSNAYQAIPDASHRQCDDNHVQESSHGNEEEDEIDHDAKGGSVQVDKMFDADNLQGEGTNLPFSVCRLKTSKPLTSFNPTRISIQLMEHPDDEAEATVVSANPDFAACVYSGFLRNISDEKGTDKGFLRRYLFII